MTTLAESASWVAGIYQLETGDPVLAGPDGIDNLQAKQLANRTVWLKLQVELAQAGLGTHAGAVDPHPQYLTAPEGDAKIAAAVAALVNSSPATLDTLAEFAAALGNDPNFATTLAGLLGLKAPLSSPAFTDNPTGPTPAQFDNDLSLINSAFAKRMGVEFSGFNSINASTVLTNSSVGGVVSAASATPINLTAPPTAGVPHGGAILFTNAGNGAVTLLGAGADLTTNQSGVPVSIVLGLGDSAWLVKVTGEWRLEGGSIALKYAAAFGSTLAASGEQKLPGGFIKKWGLSTANNTSSTQLNGVTFPLAAPNGVLNIQLTHLGGVSSVVAVVASVPAPTKNGFSWMSSYTGGSMGVYWEAIVY